MLCDYRDMISSTILGTYEVLKKPGANKTQRILARVGAACGLP